MFPNGSIAEGGRQVQGPPRAADTVAMPLLLHKPESQNGGNTNLQIPYYENQL